MRNLNRLKHLQELNRAIEVLEKEQRTYLCQNRIAYGMLLVHIFLLIALIINILST